MQNRRIYLDYASLTPVDPRVLREMRRFSAPRYANPSSLYAEGVLSRKVLEKGRAGAAGFLHAHADEIVFTSGGTEANGLALEGACRSVHRNGFAAPHLVISGIEHSSVMETAAMMEKQGVRVTRLPVDSSGIVLLEELKKALTPDTFMVSVMTVNNEIGTIQPIREIVKLIRRYRARLDEGARRYPLFHTDASQAALYRDLNVEQLGIDLMTLDGSKAYGPRGIGMLYVRRGTPIEPIIHGGGQERGLRSGTENIPAVKGLARALEIAAGERDREASRIAGLKSLFLDGLRAVRPDIVPNPPDRSPKPGSAAPQIAHIPHILNVAIPGIDSEFLTIQLDAKGVAVSTKSSCLRDEDESYVLKAIGADSRSSLRFSFGRWTKKADIRRALAFIRLLC